MSSGRWRRFRAGCREDGGVALEFIFLAPFVLLLIYAVIGYSIAFLMLHSINQLSAEAARAAVAVSTAPGIDPGDRDDAIQARIDAVLEGSWFRADQVSGCADGSFFSWDSDGSTVSVCIEISNPVPAIRLGGAEVPHFGPTFSGWSRVRMSDGGGGP